MLMLHQSTATGGMSGMDMVDQVKLAPGGKVSFAPGGYHLMCEHPKMKVGWLAPGGDHPFQRQRRGGGVRGEERGGEVTMKRLTAFKTML